MASCPCRPSDHDDSQHKPISGFTNSGVFLRQQSTEVGWKDYYVEKVGVLYMGFKAGFIDECMSTAPETEINTQEGSIAIPHH